MTRHLSAVPDPAERPDIDWPTPQKAVDRGARTIPRATLLKAMHDLGLLTRYVRAIGFEEGGLWIHSVVPGKSGGDLVTEPGPNTGNAYVEYIPIDWTGEDEIPTDIEVINTGGDDA